MKRKTVPKKRETVANQRLTTLRKRVAKAPTAPGVYRWLNDEGTVLYVGKAKNLRNRLRSYVTKDTAAGPWKQSFLGQIADFDVTVTNTEVEALIFETNLIKELRPKYNILMKDDKNYIYAKVTVQDPFPRVEAARKIEEDPTPPGKSAGLRGTGGAKYFGPMATGGELWAMLTMLRTIFPFRTCGMEIVPVGAVSSERSAFSSTAMGADSLKLKAESLPLDVICRHKDRPTPCLDYHIEKCSAPCIGRRTPEEYFRESIEGVMRFLKGDYESVRPVIKARMKKAAADRRFELAAQLRDYLEALDRLEGKQLITDTSGEDSDIIAVALLSGRADVVVMQRRGGRLIGDRNVSLSGHAENPGDVLGQFLPQFYEEGSEVPEEILVNAPIPGKAALEEWLTAKKGRKVKIVLPARGRKSHLLQLAEKNVLEKARQREAKWEAEKRNTETALAQLQEFLALPAPPERIEGYDISHLGGTETVGSMVVIKGGKAANDQYRSFTIRTMKSGVVDDYRALKEVLTRRIRHLVGGLKREEELWKEKGITFGKVRKEEQEDILRIHENYYQEINDEDIDFKRYIVARHEGNIMSFCCIVEHAGGYKELKSLWVQPDYRGAKLGQFLIRKMLAMQKRTPKIYIAAKTDLVEYYGALGFRPVQRPPAVIAEKHERAARKKGVPPGVIMVYIAAEHRDDTSLQSKPDLLVIDGGKGQLSAVLEVLSTLKIDIPVIGLAKREEEVFVPGRADPVTFPQDSPAKFLLMRLRDEAHRSANRHREARGKKTSKVSLLDAVPGLGEEGKKKLLRKFGSLSGIREASDRELLEVLSALQVGELRRHFS